MPDDREDALPEYPMPPEALGLRWHSSAMKQTRYGLRRMSHSRKTDAFLDLWESHDGSHGLRRLGYTYERGDGIVTHWGKEEGFDAIEVEALAARVEAARERERSEARRVRALLQDEVDRHAWALSPQSVLKARELIAGGLMRHSQRADATILAGEFAAAVARAGKAVEKAKSAASAEDLHRCHHPEVRGAVHEACQVLSLADEDHAAIRNASGWSKSTSHRGHWLAELGALTPELAAVGLGLVRTHLRQLRPDLVAVLTGVPPVRDAA